MWELIAANRRKSAFLFVGMGAVLILLGYFVGAAYFYPDGGFYGLAIAGAIWVILSLVSYFSGKSIMLAVSGAKEVSHDIHPQLFNVVEEMKISANLPAMPKVYIIDDPAMNAFATGRNPQDSAVAVTAGLLSTMNRDELQGVVAHEISHIMNRDILFMTFAGVMLGSIVMVSEVFLRSMWYTGGRAGGRRYRSSSGGKGGGQIQLFLMIAAIVLAILAPIIARMFYFAISRKREYLADASAVRLTRYPEGLASALEKLSNSDLRLASVNRATAPLFIDNPLRKKDVIVRPFDKKRRFSNPFATHPPLEDRISILRKMTHGVNFTEYQKAFGGGILPGSALKDGRNIPLRDASTEEAGAKSRKSQQRDLGDLMAAVNQYAFILCACGLKMKIPPKFNKPEINCPKCGRKHEVPVAELAAATAIATGAADAAKKKESKPNIYHRRSKGMGWESFYCSCGKLLQISPQFEGDHVTCKKCGAKTMVE